MTGSSNSPLAAKLGVKPHSALSLVHAPSGFTLEVPDGVTVRRRGAGPADVVVAFFTRASALAREIDALAIVVFPSSSLWVAWPKKSSSLSSDLSDHVVRDVALPLGLVDNKVCAIDETWSALRLVWRVDRRGASPTSTRRS